MSFPFLSTIWIILLLVFVYEFCLIFLFEKPYRDEKNDLVSWRHLILVIYIHIPLIHILWLSSMLIQRRFLDKVQNWNQLEVYIFYLHNFDNILILILMLYLWNEHSWVLSRLPKAMMIYFICYPIEFRTLKFSLFLSN